MALPHTLTTDFTEAVDNLIQDATIPDRALHSRAQRYLEVFDGTNTVQVDRGPAWAERIHKASPHRPPFTTPKLFHVMYQVADELGLVAGRRYVSAAICVCGEHAARADGAAGPEERANLLAQALHQLSSTWTAFLLWPFYAHGSEDRPRERDALPEACGDETPTAESIAREQRRRWKEQVMARDDYRCFMSGGLDSRAYYRGRPVPAGARVVFCHTVSIIPAELWADDASKDREFQSDQHLPPSEQDIMLGVLKRFCAIDDTALIEKAEGPPNMLFVNGAAESAFSQLLWCLHPTETPNRYEIKSYMSSLDAGCRHVTSHVTFVDHSGAGVGLPDRELLRTHAALTGVLHRSGAADALGFLTCSLPRLFRGAGRSVYPASRGGAFWRSVVEYEGPEVCLEVELRQAVEALRHSTGAVASHAAQ